jgi:hypothetical protein
MRERMLIEEEVSYMEDSSARATHLAAVQLEVLLDIRDLLTQIRAQTREIIITHSKGDEPE